MVAMVSIAQLPVTRLHMVAVVVVAHEIQHQILRLLRVELEGVVPALIQNQKHPMAWLIPAVAAAVLVIRMDSQTLPRRIFMVVLAALV